MNKIVQITPRDMVAVALQPLPAGEAVNYGAGEVTPLSDIPMGHKVALRDIAKGEPVIKYGFPIGEATEDIPKGGHVHSHNLHTLLSGPTTTKTIPPTRRLRPASP
ncbi:MAG: UxaA family hydrolase [Clostridia bacterium]|nr:UxaA family hydrolase [Clostridia bacterium]